MKELYTKGSKTRKLRSQFWVPHSKQQIRKKRKQCSTCQRYDGRLYIAVDMENSSSARVNQSRLFSHIGVNFAGIMYVKHGKALKKVCLCLFTYGVTSTVYLEIVKESSTSKLFLLCLRRCAKRMGMTSLIISDNVKKFIAAAKLLKQLMKDEEVQKYLMDGWRH